VRGKRHGKRWSFDQSNRNLLLHEDKTILQEKVENFRVKYSNALDDFYNEQDRADIYKSKFLDSQSQLNELQDGNLNASRKRRRDSREY
jgi:hypothetical protein